MGAAALPTALPALLSAGVSMMGGAGKAQAGPAAAGPDPLTAGLLSPPTPEKNPAFHGDAGELASPATLVKERPELASMFAKLSEKPAPNLRDSSTSFENKPWATETIYGQPASSAPQPAATRGAPPQAGLLPSAPPRPQPQPPAPTVQTTPQAAAPTPQAALAQSFDTSAPSAPAGGDMFGGFGKWAKGIPTDPLAQIGLSLLASGYDGSNPYSGMQTSLGNIPRLELAMQSGRIAQSAADRAARNDAQSQEDKKREEELALLVQALAGQYSQPEYSSSSKVARNAAKVIK